MNTLVRWGLVGAWLVAASPAWAGEVKLSFSNGLVTVVAIDASPREILTEWARLGQARVTNLDRLAGAPVTLQLTDVPETRALETILRGTAGYIAAPRRESISAVSRYDRILLMPGVAPAVAAVAPTPQPQNPIVGRGRIGPQPFGGPGGPGTESPEGTAGFATGWAPGVTPPGPYRPATQTTGQQSFVVAQPVESDTTPQQAAPPPASAQVPGMPAGRTGQWNGATRPGEVTPSAPGTTTRLVNGQPQPPSPPGGQPPAQGPVGPIKVPE